MPSALTFPGVYVEEIPSGVRTIVGVSTSSTAFVDYFNRGPLDEAVRITSLAEFDRIFGGIDPKSEASYAISQYFLNGGSVAYVVRVAGGTPAPATLELPGTAADSKSLKVSAASPGTWAAQAVQVAIVNVTSEGADPELFNVFVREVAVENGVMVPGPQVLRVESFRGLTVKKGSSNFVETALEASELVTVDVIEGEGGAVVRPAGSDGGDTGEPATEQAWGMPAPPADPPAEPPADPPADPPPDPPATVPVTGGPLTDGDDGTPPTTADDLLGKSGAKLRKLDAIAPEVFNLLCLPAAAGLATAKAAYDGALAYCIEKRAFLLVDIPTSVTTPKLMRDQLAKLPSGNHAAVYFPRLTMPDPANGGRPRNVGASGTIAGIYARTDGTRGVWKAPAGTEAVIRGADLATVITDGDNGGLNPFGINALRNFPIFGSIVWGARTLDGADAKASEWKYVPVRRTALFIEESLFQALKWVVFEPNDEPLWAQIRLNVGAFMNDLFRQGAFQGRTPREAYFVACSKDTTTQNDIDKGIVNIAVGFAPLKPAEFVVIKLQQMAGQVQV
jgi:phage tail sheath protein FI